jgi:hypothetical protein
MRAAFDILRLAGMALLAGIFVRPVEFVDGGGG